RSIILQQPLDVIEFDLGTGRIGQAAAQFFEDPAHPLHVDLAGDFHGIIVGEFVVAHRPAERMGRIGRALLAASRIAGAVAGLVAVALLHGFGQALGALAQRFQRAALRVHRTVGIALAEPAGGIAHCVIGLIEPVLAIALVAALALLHALFAALTLLTLLALLAALARPHAALGEFFLQFLEPIAQALLVLLQVAHALVALLAARAVAPGILALLVGLVAQLLLLADHVAELVQRLLHV